MKRRIVPWQGRPAMLVAGALVLACAWSAQAQEPRPTAVRAAPAASGPESDRAAFNRAVDRLPAENWQRMAPARVAPAWDVLDALVVRRLNAGVPLDSVNAELATLHRFEPAPSGLAERIGGGVYWRELARDLPSWFVGGLPELGEDRLLGLYNLGLGTPGRATLFVRPAGAAQGWRAAARIAATLPLSLTIVPGAGEAPGLVAVERLTGADRSECSVSLWRVRAGQLLRERSLPGTYWDCDVETGDSTVLLAYARKSTVLTTSLLGPRLLSEMAIALRGDRWSLATRPLNPWLHDYERFYRLGGAGAARAIVSKPALLRGLSRRVLDDGGDAAGGSGWVLVEDARGQRRVDMTESQQGVWQVVQVVPVSEER